jgi:branched-chain amino acid transport system substrate-binding protein
MNAGGKPCQSDKGVQMFKSLGRFGAPLAVAIVALGTITSTATAATHHAAKKTYTIAYEGPLSGGNQQLGLNMEYSVQLAVAQANSGAFGALPFKLKFLAEDDGGSATQSPTAAAALVNNPSVVAVVGPAFSGATAAAEPQFSAANLATVSPSATAPKLATQGWHNFFRVVADDNAQGPADALYVAKVLKAKAVYSVDDASTYAVGLVSAFDSAAQTDGLKLSHQEAPGTSQCQAGTGDVSEYPALATQIKSSGAPVVFYAGYYCDFALLAQALRSAGYTGQLMSDDGSNDPGYIKDAGVSDASGTLVSCACADLSKVKAAKPFFSSFKKLAKFPVGTYSAEAYDATNAIITVMKGLGTHITRSAIAKGLKHVNYQGITKDVKFLPNGNIAGTAVYMYKVKGSSIVQVGLISQLVKK